MKKLVLFPVLLVFAASLSHAQTSVSLTIQGVVPVVFRISTDMSDTEMVDLVNASYARLGNVVVYSNTRSAWTITITSLNGGRMIGTTAGNSDTYPYQLNFGDLEGISLEEAYRMSFNVRTAGVGTEYALGIQYPMVGNLPLPIFADTYRDTLTVTVRTE